MGESCFQKALSNVTSELAYKSAIRHLYDLGKSPEEIGKELLYPLSKETILSVIEEYQEEKKNPTHGNHFVEEIDRFGRKSYRKI